MNEAAQKKLFELQGGETLQVAVELNNPATALALQLETANDYHMIGWAPRYLVKDLVAVICGESPNDLSARVVKVNLSPAPSRQRVLIEIKGRWKNDYKPMASTEFEPLCDSKDTAASSNSLRLKRPISPASENSQTTAI